MIKTPLLLHKEDWHLLSLVTKCETLYLTDCVYQGSLKSHSGCKATQQVPGHVTVMVIVCSLVFFVGQVLYVLYKSMNQKAPPCIIKALMTSKTSICSKPGLDGVRTPRDNIMSQPSDPFANLLTHPSLEFKQRLFTSPRIFLPLRQVS